ncbi:TRAP transporter small permease subunit [Oceanicella sp. SM1341]|uniref:TRAP transporter small permease subunit n=1 Tax=Oceanicella sp. SM1341 TaxID=1548889 RepID=UPI000E55291A|nr:TRAP transporter small permease [Oceanicella sp. SM1341]
MDETRPVRFGPLIRGIDAITLAGGVVAAACLMALFGLIFAEVLARNIWGTSLSFSWDYAAYMMGACFLLAGGSALRGGAHVRVTALHEVVPARAVWCMDLAACLAGLLVTAFILWALGHMAWLSFGRGTTASSVIKTPLWIPQLVLAVGALIFVLQMLAQLLRVLRGETLIEDPKTEEAA